MIASENIPVFKILNKIPGTNITFSSIYQQSLYVLGKRYTSRIMIEDNINAHYGDDSYLCNEAIHSYNPKVAIKVSGILIKLIGNHDGFLDYFTFDEVPKLVKAEGIIPKGSLYQVNMYGEYISNHIILTRVGKIFR
jgi:hypothetical protein